MDISDIPLQVRVDPPALTPGPALERKVTEDNTPGPKTTTKITLV